VIAARDVPGVNNFMPRFASDIFPFSARYNFPDYGRHLALDHSPVGATLYDIQAEFNSAILIIKHFHWMT